MVEVSTLTHNLGNLGFWMCSTGGFKQNCFRSHCSPIVPPPPLTENHLAQKPLTELGGTPHNGPTLAPEAI